MKKKKLLIASGIFAFSTVCTKIARLVNHGSKYNLNYLRTVERINKNNLTFKKDEDGFYSIYNESGKYLKILQFADIHIGGGFLSRHEDRLAMKTIEEITSKTKPDLIVLNGDMVCSRPQVSFSRNNMNSIVQLTMMMEKMGIPYAVTFGEKDSTTYATHSREKLRKYLMKQNNCLMAWDGDYISGSSNYLVKVRNRNGAITNVLYFLDSNSYVRHGRNSLDYVHSDQVKWYEKQVLRIMNSEGRNIPSVMFTHLPMAEYQKAWSLYESGDNSVKYLYGKVNETISKPAVSSTLFDKLRRLGSTKAVICGHNHLNNFSVIYKGINLTCGKSMDYILYGRNVSGHRGGTLIYLSPDGKVTTKG